MRNNGSTISNAAVFVSTIEDSRDHLIGIFVGFVDLPLSNLRRCHGILAFPTRQHVLYGSRSMRDNWSVSEKRCMCSGEGFMPSKTTENLEPGRQRREDALEFCINSYKSDVRAF